MCCQSAIVPGRSQRSASRITIVTSAEVVDWQQEKTKQACIRQGQEADEETGDFFRAEWN
jgi:hypothetical protein